MDTMEHPLQGYRINRDSLNVGDYFRWKDGNENYTGRWWKILSITPPAGPGASHKVTIVNDGGHQRDATLMQGVRLIRHPYSQRQAEARRAT
jgi:hypothetical protein